jgi:hypothetical protein
MYGLYYCIQKPELRERFGLISQELAKKYPTELLETHCVPELRGELVRNRYRGSIMFYEVDSSDIEKSNERIQEFVRAAAGIPFQMVLLCESKFDYFDLASRFEIGNLILDGKFDLPLLHAITRKLLFDDLFGFKSFFPQGTPLFHQFSRVSGQVDREQLFDLYFAPFCETLPPAEQTIFKMVTSELMVNAMDYAIRGISPEERDREGKRNIPAIEIPGNRWLELGIVQDDEKWGVVVSDLSGSLTLKRVLEKFRRHVVLGEEGVPLGLTDRTGRGLFILSRSNRLVINVLKEIKTEIIVLHYRDASINKYQPLIFNERSPQYELRYRGYIAL